MSFSETRLRNHLRAKAVYINEELKRGADVELQRRYPEGYIFAHALIALACIELSEVENDTLMSLASERINSLLSDRATATFDPNLSLPHGAFYNGWTNLVLCEYIVHSLNPEKSISEVHCQLSDFIVSTWMQSDELLKSYEGATWPADNIICLASVRSHPFVEELQWSQKMQRYAITEHGLLPHCLEEEHEVRASSQSLYTYGLSKLDMQKAAVAYEEYADLLIDRVLGIHLAKEYMGKGEMDVDSGPVVLGYGSVATLLNVGLLAMLGELKDARCTYALLHVLGLPTGFRDNTRYLFGQELMFDIFMLWVGVSLLSDPSR